MESQSIDKSGHDKLMEGEARHLSLVVANEIPSENSFRHPSQATHI
jgi:hypothetical protein